MTWRYHYTIHGRPVSKKNGHRVRYCRGRQFVGNSFQYIDWAESAIMELKCQRGRTPTIPIAEKVGITLTVFLDKGQREMDLDNVLGAPFDALEGAGVVKNDRQFKLVRCDQLRDPLDPRIEIELTPWVDS